MDAFSIRRHLVAVMAKHLPPSSSTLRLLDLDGRSGDLLATLRSDLDSRHIPATELGHHAPLPGAFDAIVALDIALSDTVLATALQSLRDGGRFIAIQSNGKVSQSHLRRLQEHGYVRILIEPALDGLGLLIRGEKRHATADTLERIQSVASGDEDSLEMSRFRGRYVHFLIQQRPNKPVWKLDPGERISWRAAAIKRDSSWALLAFSSLPKAVGFMQPSILAEIIHDINKVGKFSLSTVQKWEWDIILNPSCDLMHGETLTYIDIDPALAEAPDE
ncbi:MAG: hypothetical protein OXI30_06020 [Chloroflexota bacterium]|nr:hypothetical protein [Chloroflexota bacterium]